MNHIIIPFYLAAILLLASCAKPDNSVQVTYLGNCSFVYQGNDSKVIIDPFGTDYGSYFILPADSIQEKVLAGDKPFDNIDLLLITHIHGDHFNPFLTADFLVKHPTVKLVCPTQVYENLQDSCSNFKSIKEQIISPEIQIGKSETIEINGIDLKIIRMQHGTMRSLEGVEYSEYTDYEKTENSGYLVGINGKQIFHQGDGCLKINQEALANNLPPVDIANLSFFDWDSTSYNFTKNQMQASHVIFMHGTIPADELKKEEFTEVLPELVVFDKEMESKTF